MKEARLKTFETKALCDLITAQLITNDPRLKSFLFEDWENIKDGIQNSKELKSALEILEPLQPIHFPISFPEVFLGKTKGFNVILGNPPWEKVHVREDEFLGKYLPGVRGLSQREKEKAYSVLFSSRPELKGELIREKQTVTSMAKILLKGSFPGISSGDILYSLLEELL